MKFLMLALFMIGAASSYVLQGVNFLEDNGWQLWKKTHGKTYETPSQERVRYVIWQENLRKIEQHNAGGDSDMVLRMNHLGDLTNMEYRTMMNGYRMGGLNRTRASTFLAPSNMAPLPVAVDWRKEGYVTDVKNQGQCGSCWAFSTTGSLEGQTFKKTGKLVSLSEQNLVDCSTKYGNMGCNGGLMDQAFQYIKENPGIDTEKSYPYEAVDGTCRFKKADVGAEDTGFVDIEEGSEDELQKAVATVGPISVAIDASHFSFQFYHHGVYNEKRCSSTRLDHGVLAVGYGTYKEHDYWLVKNSWGESWGLDGYIMMTRNKKNQCGIASKASYPLV